MVSVLVLLPWPYHWTIDDYQFGGTRAFECMKEVRRQSAYFAKGSVPCEHFTRCLGAEQSRIIELSENCLGARQVAIMQHALQHEPSPSDVSMQAGEAAVVGEAA